MADTIIKVLDLPEMTGEVVDYQKLHDISINLGKEGFKHVTTISFTLFYHKESLPESVLAELRRFTAYKFKPSYPRTHRTDMDRVLLAKGYKLEDA